MLGFGFQAWLLGLKPMGFGFRPPPVKPLQGAKGVRGMFCEQSCKGCLRASLNRCKPNTSAVRAPGSGST